MRKILVSFALIGMPLCATAQQLPAVLKFGVVDACPFQCPGAKDKGFNLDTVERVFADLGVKAEFVNMPWTRAVTEVQQGRIDGLVGPAKLEAPGLVFSSESIATQSDCFFGRTDDSWSPKGSASFAGRTSLVFKGWSMEASYQKELGAGYSKAFSDFPLDAKYVERAIQMVMMGRADAFWQDPSIVAYYHFSGQGAGSKGKIKNLGCLSTVNLYMGFNPLKPQVSKLAASKFDEGLRKLRASGELKKILDRYGLADWVKK